MCGRIVIPPENETRFEKESLVAAKTNFEKILAAIYFDRTVGTDRGGGGRRTREVAGCHAAPWMSPFRAELTQHFPSG